MYRLSEVVGKSIVSSETGDRVGKVGDVLIEAGTAHIVGLVIDGGLLGKEHVLPFSDVQALGGDNILTRNQSGTIGPSEWRQSDTNATRASALRGRAVVTVAGRRLGSVSDLLVNEKTGAFAALEVAQTDLGGLRTRHSVVPASEGMRIGPDAIVVPDDSVEGDNTGVTDQTPPAKQP